MQESNHYNAVIIGGGFYGLRIALFLRERIGIKNILVIEKERGFMSRASYVNQARVHNGYHYPRSILTGARSSANFSTFVDEYGPAIVSDFDKYYAIARHLSKVNAKQFEGFCRKIGAEFEAASDEIAGAFAPHLIEKVYKVREYAFNAHILRDLLLEKLEKYADVTVRLGESVTGIDELHNAVRVATDRATYTSERVFNCTYSQINNLHRKSGLPLVGIKHEITEMCLVKLPRGMDDFSVTVMDGPFFSIMPFPSRGLHTLSHVRYTPHTSWLDDRDTPQYLHDTHEYFKRYRLNTAYKKMAADVVRYIPALKGMEFKDTISEVKTVLVKSEDDDGRPILFKPDFGIKGYNCIMGGKLDNIYDVFVELEILYGKR